MLRVSLLKYILNYKYLLSSPKKNQYQRAPLSHHICSCFSADHCELLCTTVLFTSILRIVACFANMLWTFLDWNVLLLTLVLMVILKIHCVAGAKKCYKEIRDSLRSEKCFFMVCRSLPQLKDVILKDSRRKVVLKGSQDLLASERVSRLVDATCLILNIAFFIVRALLS